MNLRIQKAFLADHSKCTIMEWVGHKAGSAIVQNVFNLIMIMLTFQHTYKSTLIGFYASEIILNTHPHCLLHSPLSHQLDIHPQYHQLHHPQIIYPVEYCLSWTTGNKSNTNINAHSSYQSTTHDNLLTKRLGILFYW